ncbi:hypothetical protein J1614_004786 [Plenodomus biglobosus]|nr:hypothetical protein J1614_004786 [Plenodomus biglobosus]
MITADHRRGFELTAALCIYAVWTDRLMRCVSDTGPFSQNALLQSSERRATIASPLLEPLCWKSDVGTADPVSTTVGANTKDVARTANTYSTAGLAREDRPCMFDQARDDYCGEGLVYAANLSQQILILLNVAATSHWSIPVVTVHGSSATATSEWSLLFTRVRSTGAAISHTCSQRLAATASLLPAPPVSSMRQLSWARQVGPVSIEALIAVLVISDPASVEHYPGTTTFPQSPCYIDLGNLGQAPAACFWLVEAPYI